MSQHIFRANPVFRFSFHSSCGFSGAVRTDMYWNGLWRLHQYIQCNQANAQRGENIFERTTFILVFRVKTLTNPQNASGETGFTVPPLCFSAVKVLLVRRLLFAAFLPQNTVNTLPYLLRFLYLVFQCEIAAGQLLPLGGQLLLLRFLRSLSVCAANGALACVFRGVPVPL